MGKIAKLDQHTINSIAAGEVIERPASVVKELVDNALDAGAETIEITIKAGGVREIRVKDNGTGMTPEDASLSLQSHTTSKLRSVQDLDHISSMGFRGEALASIAAVSRLTLVTRLIGVEDGGFRIETEGGKTLSEGSYGAPEGTTITVRDLFYNTPARYKFLKSDQAEAAQVQERVTHLALSRPDVSFKLEKDNKTVLHTPGNNDLLSAIYAVFGSEIASAMKRVNLDISPIEIQGFMTTPDAYYRSTRTRQVFIVNGRVVRSRVLQAAVDEAAANFYVKGRHPALVFHLRIPFAFVDVNVHPQKSEVRFWDDKKVFSAVYHAVKKALEDDTLSPEDSGDSLPVSDESKLSPESELPTTYEDRQREQIPLQQSFPGFEKAEAPFTVRERIDEDTGPVDTADRDAIPQVYANDTITSKAVDEEPFDRAEHSPTTTTTTEGRRKIDRLRDAKILGQYVNTYIVLQIDDQLVLIDQHAAHERILYERLQRREREEERLASRQALLMPVEIEVTPEESVYLDAHVEELMKRGFEVEPFGPNAYLLRSVPDLKQEVDAKRLFQGLLSVLAANEFVDDQDMRERFAMKACKAAAKANQSLSEVEIRALLDDLLPLDNPYHCPHGRPIMIAFTKKEVEKRFGRIV